MRPLRVGMRFSSLTPFVLALVIASVSASPLALFYRGLLERQTVGSGSAGLVDERSFVTSAGRLKRNCAFWAWYPDDGLIQVYDDLFRRNQPFEGR